MSWFTAWRRRQDANLRQRVAEDAENVRLLMQGVILDARRVGAEVPAGIVASTVLWRSWTERLEAFAQEQ
jgi:hypothetical protein